METITFRQLAQHVAEKLDYSKKDVLEILRFTNQTVITQVKKGNKVRMTGLGSFARVRRKSRQSRNPQTGEPITTKAHNAPKFKASKQFKKTIY